VTSEEATAHAEHRDERAGFEPLLHDLLRLQASGAEFSERATEAPAPPLPEADRQALAAREPGMADRILGRVAAAAASAEHGTAMPDARLGESGGASVFNPESDTPVRTQTMAVADRGATISELATAYRQSLDHRRIGPYRLGRRLGRGGQGEVYLTRIKGADGFRVRVALKAFSPDAYASPAAYDGAMRRIAPVISRIAQTNHDHLVDVHRFEMYRGIRIMLMDLVDGLDLRRLLRREHIEELKHRISQYLWRELCNVVFTLVPGSDIAMLKPGVAVTIARQCLEGLTSLHKKRIVHGDVKPSNIMIRTTGTAKIIDFGSASKTQDTPQPRAFTLAYAAPETIERLECTPRSDLASLGYVLVEMLSGCRLFPGLMKPEELLIAKRALPERLHEVLPPHVRCCKGLVDLCRRLVAANPGQRFESAEQADLDLGCGASSFLFSLVRGDLAYVFEQPVARWVEETQKLLTSFSPAESAEDESQLTTSSALDRSLGR
jgi:serine/threonine-protein kinase